MKRRAKHDGIERLITQLSRLWEDPADRIRLADAVRGLADKYALSEKLDREPGVAEIISQMVGRISTAFGSLARVQGLRVLDIACGSNTSRMPPSLYINTPFGGKRMGRTTEGYTAQFEPWFCRILLELAADPVGVDFGALEGERFEHYRVDLGQRGALSFLPSHSFDAVQDSRLFGSPEFTAQFPNRSDRLGVAQEIRREEHRLLKTGGLVIHSDAEEMLSDGTGSLRLQD